ncbi:Os03g0282100 [Oryza sativa Japonica Group]|uniref:ABC transporter G family member 5 n=1 Tax=Oryza sativa subsp. japonica TaxID=39947 RepID=A0A0P0VWU6_ORYSJ|nr:Os03g0282100 [Oryza sativa Japonica Group]
MSSSFRSRRTLPIEEDGEDAPRADLLPGHQRSDRRSASSTNLDQHVVLGSHSPGHVVVDLRPTAANVDGGGKLELDPVGRMPVHFVLAFHDLTYNVGRPRRMAFWRRSRHVETDATTARGGGARAREGALLLDGVSGEAREGEIMAVLGASGAGKTTLIDALADRIQRDSLRGAVTLNGEPLGGRMLKVISAYVMQDDLLYPMLTVAETLMYSAEFRLPRSLSASKKATRVQELIDQLGLRAAANTIIGDEGRRGVSGGERRRVSIGIDIIHDPIILFLDEPTSGLDSTSAFMVVKVLQGIAKSGSVVIMSIHQPSYRIIGLIDRLMFLSRGRTVYYGPPASLPLFFSEFGHPIPDGQNPVEFALDHVRQLEAIPEGTDELVEFSKAWREKALARGHQNEHRPWQAGVGRHHEHRRQRHRGGGGVHGQSGDVREPVVGGGVGAGAAGVHQHAAHAGAVPDPAGHGGGDGVHPCHRVLAAGQHTQGRERAVRLLRHRRVHHVLHQRRRAPGVPRGALHLPPGDGAQRLQAVLLHGLQRHRRLPASGRALPRLHGHHLLRRRPRRRRRGFPLLRPHRARLLLGRERLRHVPLRRGPPRDHRVHGGGGRAGLLPPPERILHHPRPHPELLDMAALPVADQVPVRGGDAERVRGGGREVLHARGADVRRDADGEAAGGDEGEGAGGDEQVHGVGTEQRLVHHDGAGHTGEAGGDGARQVELPLGHRRVGFPLPRALLPHACAREQEQEEVNARAAMCSSCDRLVVDRLRW